MLERRVEPRPHRRGARGVCLRRGPDGHGGARRLCAQVRRRDDGVPAPLDACDMIDPMVDRKSVTTSIAQFWAYEQRKLTAAPRDDAACRRSAARSSSGSTTRASSSAATLPIRAPVVFADEKASSSATSNSLPPTPENLDAGGARPFSLAASLTRTRLRSSSARRRLLSTDNPSVLAGLRPGVPSSLTRPRNLAQSPAIRHDPSSSKTKCARRRT